MKKQRTYKRHFFRHLCCAVLAALLTVCLIAACMTGMVSMVLFDRGMHEHAALDSRVTDAQMARITAGVKEICAEYGVSEDSILPLITRESVIQYNRDVIGWWMNMLQNGEASDAPAWEAADLETAVREDVLFRETVPSVHQKAMARNTVAPAMIKVISDTVIPVRSLLVTFAMTKVAERVSLPVLMQTLRLIPLVLLGVSAVLMAAICLIFRGRPRRRAIWGSSPLMACAMAVLVMLALTLIMRVPQQVGMMSGILAMQMQTLMMDVYLRMGLMMLCCLFGGAAWMHLAYRHSARRLAEEQKA